MELSVAISKRKNQEEIQRVNTIKLYSFQHQYTTEEHLLGRFIAILLRKISCFL